MESHEIQTQILAEQPTAVEATTLLVADIGPWLARAYERIAAVVADSGAQIAGPPFARYHRVANDRFTVEAGFPIAGAIGETGDVRASSLPAGPVATTMHVGPYDQLEATYEVLSSWVNDRGGSSVGDPWELYFSAPGVEPDPGTWRTRIVQPYGPA